MLDIIQATNGDKHYAAKVSVNLIDKDTAQVKIKNVKEVNPITSTSYQVLREVYSDEFGTPFSKNKFSAIFSEIMHKVASKYHVSTINYAEK